jgi:hypothetical protein
VGFGMAAQRAIAMDYSQYEPGFLRKDLGEMEYLDLPCVWPILIDSCQ